ncbi:MAG: LptF/LptG family permease [Dissulfurispiraceae bacterium]|jgi:lipopolysaccharide export system permease protein|nr:LptF/LptG family permease [Dissulfurispiraceae bacterium]
MIMLLAQRLYMKEFIKTTATLTIGLALIFGILGFIDRMDDFMPHKPQAGQLILFIIMTIPRYVHYLMPMAILLSALFVFSQAVKRKEIVIVKASGSRMRGFLMPFVSAGVILTIFGFILAEGIVPAASKKAQTIRDRVKKTHKAYTFKEGTVYMRGLDGAVIRVGLFHPVQNISTDVTIFRFDSNGLKERIDAKTAIWENDKWTLKELNIYSIDTGKIREQASLVYEGIETPDIFKEDVVKVEEMNMVELYKYKDRLNKAGYKNQKLVVDLSAKFSYPLINLFMLLLGLSLSLGESFRVFGHTASTNTAIAAGLGLVVSLFYWLGYSLMLSLGYAGAIPGTVAPWIVPAIFAVGSVVLYRKIPE